MELNITKQDIVTALFMLHSQLRDELPESIIRENHPINNGENFFKVDLKYDALTDPLIIDLLEIVQAADHVDEAKDFLNIDEHKEKLFSVLYASQFHDQAFTVDEVYQNYSIKKPCEVLATVIHTDFYKGYLSDFIEIEVLPDVKDWVAHQELLTVVNVFSDYTHEQDDPKLQKPNRVNVLTDCPIIDGSEEIPIFTYPDFILSDSIYIQKIATFIREDLFQEKFYEVYDSMDQYFEESPYAKKFINTVINDSKTINYDEKTALEAIAEIHRIRDYEKNLDGYIIEMDKFYLGFNDAEADIEQIEESILDERNEAVELAYDSDEYVDEYLAVNFITDQFKDKDLDEELSGPLLIALNDRFNVKLLKKSITDLKENRPPSRFYADHKYDYSLNRLLDTVVNNKETDLYDLISVVNETAMNLSYFDEKNRVVSLCENFIETVEGVLKDYNKNYDDNLFKSSKTLYLGFKKSKQDIQVLKPIEDVKYTRRPDGYQGGFKGHHPEA